MHRNRRPYILLFSCTSRLALLLILLLAGTFISPSMLAAQDGTTGSGWLTFRGNPAHTGVSDLEGPAGPANAIEVKWRWQINGRRDPISASPAVTTDGTVIVGTEGGYIAAIQPEGATNWSMSLDNPILSSPAADESGNIFVVTADGYMHFIAANGETIWKSDFDRSTSSSPVLSGSEAYLGTDDDELLTINLNPDISHSGDSKKLPLYLVRKSSFLAKGNVLSSPAFSGNTVFFGGGEYIYALNPNAGDSGGGTGGGGTGENSSTTTTAGNGGGTTVNPVKWWFRANGDVNSSPAVSNGKVYVGADDGYLYAFSENTSSPATSTVPGTATSTTTSTNMAALSPACNGGCWQRTPAMSPSGSGRLEEKSALLLRSPLP